MMTSVMQIWKRLAIWQQILLVALFVSVIGFGVYQMKPDTYEVLFPNLTAEESLEIQNEIAKMNIPFQVQNDGSTILVDNLYVSDVKMKLAQQGLPYSGGPGFEILDGGTLGATKYDKENKNKQAIIGEITRGLVQGFDSIEKAYVQLDFTEKEHFFEEEKAGSASVSIQLKRGVQLSPEQIRSLQIFVAGAVQNLSADDVEIMDKRTMVTLSQSGTELSSSAAYNKQLEIENAVKEQIIQDLRPTLSRVFEEGNYTINVRPKIKFDEIVRNIEEYGDSVLVSKRSLNDNSETSEGEPLQEPGVESNGTVPDYEMNEETKVSLSTHTKEEIIENFEVEKTMSTIKEHPELINMNVSVTISKDEVDKRYIEDLDAYIDEWENIIALAAGIVVEEDEMINGNVLISVQEYAEAPDNNVEQDAYEGSERSNEDQQRIVKWSVLGGLGILMVVLMSLFMIPRHKTTESSPSTKKEKGAIQEESARTDSEEEALLHEVPNFVNKQKGRMYEVEDFSEEQTQLAEKAKEIAEDNPQRTAEFIKKQIFEE
ncbi:flagellar M-ring protein FliF (plasmid) [Pontibacillus sp. ALD_SL1]|uniref:flagellar basal-body MS-ring/collar protein FliF n=1 Tax=Pontibacillus sp. ALD_SL1 TaxID=2777185 RepID=UPI001A95D717|nr:flagellar basal-body MS-ring/collar protein FliF [Pontibacillus sp. ALD_SL1]QST03032.1 flagellar M-ring protein FliF [Pontibacillus sp. ALD_SL1]